MTDRPNKEESLRQAVEQAVAEIIITGFTEWREIELPEGGRVTLTFDPQGSYTTEGKQELGIYKPHACLTHSHKVESGIVIGLPIYEHSENEGAQEAATFLICCAAAREMINCVRRQQLRPELEDLEKQVEVARGKVKTAQTTLSILMERHAAAMALAANIGMEASR